MTYSECIAKINGYHNRRKQDDISRNIMAREIVAATYNTMRSKNSDKVWEGRDLYTFNGEKSSLQEKEESMISMLETMAKEGNIPQETVIQAKKEHKEKWQTR